MHVINTGKCCMQKWKEQHKQLVRLQYQQLSAPAVSVAPTMQLDSKMILKGSRGGESNAVFTLFAKRHERHIATGHFASGETRAWNVHG